MRETTEETGLGAVKGQFSWWAWLALTGVLEEQGPPLEQAG